MLLATGLDALEANPLDPDLMEVLRVIRERASDRGRDRPPPRLVRVGVMELDEEKAFVHSGLPRL